MAGLDEVDRRILDLLREDARRPLSDIADRVNLTSAPVKRRIARMERDGVIEGYTIRTAPGKAGADLEAFTELRVSGSTDVEEVWVAIQQLPEVEQLFTIAGDPDALMRLRVDNVEHLQRVVNQLRRSGTVVGTKTLIVLRAWER